MPPAHGPDPDKDLLGLQKEFLASVSHEMRTPLSVIMGYVQILKEETLGPLTAEQRKSLDTISARAEDLLRVMTHLLAAKDIHAGKKSLRLEPVDLRQLLQERLSRPIREKTRKRMGLEQDLGSQEVWVRADSQKIGEVMDNVLLNAFKFGPAQSSVRVEIAPAGRNAVIRVHNSCAGLSEEERRRIFEPFSAAKRGLTREHNGLGLGLYLCQEIMKDHGGTILAEASLDAAHFIVSLSIPLGSKPESASALERQPRQVLVIEDDMDFVQLMVIFLSRAAANIEVACAESGGAAMEEISRRLPELIILDLMLPGMDGLAILERLKSERRTAGIPVLIVTGHEASANKAAQAGAQDVLLKPFDEALFTAKVTALLAKARQAPSR